MKLAMQARLLTADARVALHQLPFYARVVAVLGQVFPDITSQVLKTLEEDFSRLLVRMKQDFLMHQPTTGQPLWQ